MEKIGIAYIREVETDHFVCKRIIWRSGKYYYILKRKPMVHFSFIDPAHYKIEMHSKIIDLIKKGVKIKELK